LTIENARVTRVVDSSKDAGLRGFVDGAADRCAQVGDQQMKVRYQRGSRAERSAILDELSALTGWHRDHGREGDPESAGAGAGAPGVLHLQRLMVRAAGARVIRLTLRWPGAPLIP
jgi:hypothetical protein